MQNVFFMFIDWTQKHKMPSLALKCSIEKKVTCLAVCSLFNEKVTFKRDFQENSSPNSHIVSDSLCNPG